MKKVMAVVSGLAAVAAAAGLLRASERRVQMKDLPPAVRQTVLEKTKGLTILKVEEEVTNGQTFYEVETEVNGESRDIKIDSSGAVVEMEQEIALDAVPEAARTAIEREAGDATIERVESVTDDGVTVYEVTLKKDGKKSEIVVTSEGKLQGRH
jgi:uncharacterized membrane protein YkoI